MNNAMDIEQVSMAMGQSRDEFLAMLPALKVFGFPEPSILNGDFKMTEIFDWLVKQQDINLSNISRLADHLNAS